MEIFQPWHLILIAIVVIVFFGGKKLPELGKGLGEGFRSFKDGLKGINEDPKPSETVTPPVKTEESVTK